jgi:hypothetical protein
VNSKRKKNRKMVGGGGGERGWESFLSFLLFLGLFKDGIKT